MNFTLPLRWRAALASWRKARSTRVAGSGKQAARLELAHSSTGGAALAFGVQWRTVATSGGRADAIKLARAAGATHYVFRGSQVGMGVLAAQAQGRARVVPALLVAARQHVGTSICALALGGGEYWLAATANGQPTSADQFLQGLDHAAVLARVRELRERLDGAASVSVYTNISNSGIEGALWLSAEDMLAFPAPESDLLAPLPSAGFSIPKPVLGFLAAAVALLIGQEGFKKWEQQRRMQQAAQAQSAEVDPVQAWAAAIGNWESATAAPTGLGLAQVRESLNRVPVVWNGWNLATASCAAGSPVSGAPVLLRSWSCKAGYVRGRAGDFNRSMAAQLPSGFSATFIPLAGLELAWTLQQPVQRMNIQALHKVTHFEIEAASRLQRLLPALSADLAMAFVPVAIVAPKKADGTALPPDARAERLRQASLVVRAPLRSIDALIAADIEADWVQLSVQYGPPDLKGGLKNSALMAEAKGNVYAQK